MSATVSAYLYIDWDRDGNWDLRGGTYEYSNRLISLDLTLGLSSPDLPVASVGQMTAVLSNTDRLFSPENTGSALYGLLKPGAPVKVTTMPVGGSETTLFLGKVSRISLTSGMGADPTVEQEQLARDLVAAHDPVWLETDRTGITADGAEEAVITVRVKRQDAAPVTLVVKPSAGAEIEQAIDLVDGVGTLELASEDPQNIRVTVKDGAARCGYSLLFMAV